MTDPDIPNFDFGLLFVNFHHVRPNNPEPYRGLHHITPSQLKNQVQLLSRYFDFPDPKIVRKVIKNREKFGGRVCVLTFDDGLKDHAEFVEPLLAEMGIRAIFSINTAPWVEQQLLSVHMAHLLSAAFGYQSISGELEAAAHEQGIVTSIADVDPLKSRAQYRYDEVETGRIKFFINAMIPQEKRVNVLRTVFNKRVGNEQEMAANHYLSRTDVKNLVDSGHTVALHTHNHLHMASCSEEVCDSDLAKNQQLLREALGVIDFPLHWLSYPYGSTDSYNEQVIRVASLRGCDMGLTMTRGVNRNFPPAMTLRRVDTHDVPGGKAPISWESLANG